MCLGCMVTEFDNAQLVLDFEYLQMYPSGQPCCLWAWRGVFRRRLSSRRLEYGRNDGPSGGAAEPIPGSASASGCLRDRRLPRDQLGLLVAPWPQAMFARHLQAFGRRCSQPCELRLVG